MATKTSLLGLTKPAYTDAADIAVLNGNFDLIDKAVGQGARVGNLLDNSWFGNPINQRGSTEVSTDSDSYFIDRWVGYQGTFSLRNNSIQIQANRQYGALLQQFVQKLEDGVYTFAGKVDGSIVWRVVQISGNTVTTLDNNNAAFSNGAGYLYVQTQGDKVYNFHFRANVGYTIVVEWAALYEGAYTADTLPAYVYKGYAAELAECQRYFERLPLHLMMDNTDKIVIMDRTRVVKRIYPTTIANATDSSESGASVAFWDSNGDFIRGVIEFSTTGNQYWYGYLDISADL